MGAASLEVTNRPHARHVWRWVLAGTAAVLLLISINLAWAGVRAVEAFSQARDDLQQGGAALQAGQLDEARNLFGAAASAGTQATSALNHPAVRVLGLVPGLGNDVDALRHTSRA